MRERYWKRHAALAILAVILAAAAPAPNGAASPGPAPADTVRVSLDECVAHALAASEEARVADADYATAHALYLRARSTILPQVTASASYTRQIESIYRQGADLDFEPFDPDTLAPLEQRVRDLEAALPDASLEELSRLFQTSAFGSRHSWISSIDVSQKLFQGGFVWHSIAAARHALRAARLAREDAHGAIVLGVREAYLAALRSDRALRIAELALEQADTQLARVRLRQEVGDASEFDLLQAEVARDNQAPAVKEAIAAREVAYLDLRRVANLPDAPLHLTTSLLAGAAIHGDPATAAGAALADTAGIVAAALRNTGILSLEEQFEARRHAEGITGSNRWPKLSLFANFSEQAFPDDFLPSSGDWKQDSRAGFAVDWNVFDGFLTKGAIEEARAQRTMTEAALLRAREGVTQAVVAARGELARSASDLDARARTVVAARRAHELATLRYDEGVASLLEVSEARIAHQIAQTNEARARHDYFAALARLERFTGRPFFAAAAANSGDER